MKHSAKFLLAFLVLSSQALLFGETRFHGPIIQWHRDPATSATFTWVERDVGKSSSQPAYSAEWKVGPSGFGFGDDDDATELYFMNGRFKRIYLAASFVVPNFSTYNDVTLEMDYDDAFIAYINGREVARSSTISGSGSGASVDSHESGKPERFKIQGTSGILTRGQNLICIEVHNSSTSSSDMTAIPRLTVNGKDIIKPGDKWAYLAGRDPGSGWKSSYPTIDAPKKKTYPGAAGWQLVLQRRDGSDRGREITYTSRPFGTSKSVVHLATADNLYPNTEYEFVLSIGGTVRKKGWFRTAPLELRRPISFVVGGDMGTSGAKAICSIAGKEDVTFGYIGGDLAYANGKYVDKWYYWIDNWVELVSAPDGRYVPMIAAIGNHETRTWKGSPENRAPFYFSFFDLPNNGRSNFAVDFGNYMSLICLDSDHAQDVEDQTDWLAQTLAERKKQPHIFPIYHRPAWGTGVKSNRKNIQEEWTPLFQDYQVSCVFENDHHVYKRTHKITNGKRDDSRGILHIGDGAWGAGVRKITSKGIDSQGARKYLAHYESTKHLIRVNIHPDGKREYFAKDSRGNVIDSYTDRAKLSPTSFTRVDPSLPPGAMPIAKGKQPFPLLAKETATSAPKTAGSNSSFRDTINLTPSRPSGERAPAKEPMFKRFTRNIRNLIPKTRPPRETPIVEAVSKVDKPTLDQFFSDYIAALRGNDARRWAGLFSDNLNKNEVMANRQRLINDFPNRTYSMNGEPVYQTVTQRARAKLSLNYSYYFTGARQTGGLRREILELNWQNGAWKISKRTQTPIQ